MKMPSATVILLNGAVAVIAVASVVAMGRSMIGTNAEACRLRYNNAVQWTLLREDGQLLTTSDLQARLGATDWGLMERVSVVKVDQGPGNALAVDIAGRRTAQPHSAGFEWGPQSAGPVAAACLSYAFKLDREFDFAAGGRLPGLRGGPTGSDRKAPEAFAARLAWDDKGQLQINNEAPTGAPPRLSNDRYAFDLPRGRWVTVDQEVVLNTPGQSNGILRVWLDGELRFENLGVAFRTDTASAVRGVLAEVAYTRQPSAQEGKAPVLVTPFEYRW